MSNKGEGYIDVAAPHPPLLFIDGEQDHIIPWSLVRKNFEAYSDPKSLKALKTFEGRTHYICNQQGWEGVAVYVHGWIQEVM